MELIHKQKLFRDYLLTLLGFESNNYTHEFSSYLENIAYVHRHLDIIPESEFDDSSDYADYYCLEPEIGYIKENFTIIDVLLWEKNIRINKNYTFKQSRSYITDTDLANFVYCPVGFTLSSTFDLPESVKARIGNKLHEKQVLLNFTGNYNYNYDDAYSFRYIDLINKKNKAFFMDVITSQLLYSGHSNDEDAFYNRKEEFKGKPDYVFKSSHSERYIVEEKFVSEETGDIFYENHKIQLASYIHLIDRKAISYGYLVYWVYKKNDHKHIIDCRVLKLVKNESLINYLNKVVFKVRKFKKKRYLSLNLKKNSKICAHCVHVVLCGHKSRKFEHVEYPYNISHLNLYNADYPEELKKN